MTQGWGEGRETRGKGKAMATVTTRPITSFKDLRVWEAGIELVKAVYAVCAKLPREELYGLASQMKRAAVSVPSNIAEGHSRNHRAEYRQSVYVAIGSLAELETQLHLASALRLLSATDIAPVIQSINELRAMLITLGKKLA